MVSIPTQSEDWVQRYRGTEQIGPFGVSIPTQSEDWVQPALAATTFTVAIKFQSPPSPKTGCNPGTASSEMLSACFNPHPVRRLGATGLGDGDDPRLRVSIPTQSEDWVQHRGSM